MACGLGFAWFVGDIMNLADYIPVLIQISLALGIAVAILVASHIFGQRAKTNFNKDRAYECGLPALDKSGARFSVKFYITAMLFILLFQRAGLV